jgi:hypothetical protein
VLPSVTGSLHVNRLPRWYGSSGRDGSWSAVRISSISPGSFTALLPKMSVLAVVDRADPCRRLTSAFRRLSTGTAGMPMGADNPAIVYALRLLSASW